MIQCSLRLGPPNVPPKIASMYQKSTFQALRNSDLMRPHLNFLRARQGRILELHKSGFKFQPSLSSCGILGKELNLSVSHFL